MSFQYGQSLKRPDLQGQFPCASCGQIFIHAASLNRHRRTKHNDEHTCLICSNSLNPSEDLHDHMKDLHNIPKVFTCGCCNYTFANKKFLNGHLKSIKETGRPGDFPPIAKSVNAPGSLLNHRLSVAPYSPVRGSVSPGNSSASSTSSGFSSKRVSPKPTEKKQHLAQAEHNQLFDKAISEILGSGIFTGNILTIPQTWERIIELGNKMASENLKTHVADPAVVVLMSK